MIKPTIGRVVWFWPGDVMMSPKHFAYHDKKQPCSAQVVYVWSDTCVNLQVLDQNGNAHSFSSVPLIQPGSSAPQDSCFCEWMPYQVAQATNGVAGITFSNQTHGAPLISGNVIDGEPKK